MRSLKTLLLILIYITQLQLPFADAAFASEDNPHATTPRITGTFLQLLTSHDEWSQEKWEELFGYFEELKLDRLIVQWSVFGDLAFNPTTQYTVLSKPYLEKILELADEKGMKVVIGLYHDASYWEKIRRHHSLVEVYLRRIFLESEKIAVNLAPSVKKHRSFHGWYISQEVDDVSWREPEMKKVLFQHLGKLTDRLHEITPEKQVMLSCFSNAHSDPKNFEEFWKSLFEAASIDTILFQDGIGVKKLDLDYLGLYLAAIKSAADSKSREFNVIVEIFTQTNGPPLNTKPFSAEPAPFERISLQLDMAAKYRASGIIAFSIPEYMTPLGGERATILFNQYLDSRSN